MTPRSAIIGTGFMGRVHTQAVRANGGAVVGYLGSSLASAQRAAADVDGAVGVARVEDLIALAPDLVHICSPNALHAEQARAVIDAGIAVVCEKPLATTMSDARELAARAADAEVPTAVPFVYRYHPLVRHIRQQILARPDAPPWLLHGSYLQDWLAGESSTNWRVDPRVGGKSRAFGDIGVHWCDLAEFVTGQRIVRVSAALGSAFDRGIGEAGSTEDGGVVAFETDSGALGSVVVSQVSAGRKNRLWFSFDGPLASYAFDQETPDRAWFGTQEQSVELIRDPARQSGDAARTDALPAGHAQGYQQCFNDLVADVHRALSGETVPGLPTFADGARAADITHAVLTSASRRDWVEVPSPHDAERTERR